MAGIEFDRQVFTSAAETQRTQTPKAMGAVLLCWRWDSQVLSATKFSRRPHRITRSPPPTLRSRRCNRSSPIRRSASKNLKSIARL